MPEEARAFGGGRIAGADSGDGFVIFNAGALGRLRDADERSAKVALDVDGESFDRRDIEDAAALGFFGYWSEHEPIDAPQKRGESFAGAGGCEDQRGIAAGDSGPAEFLRLGGTGENGVEPIADGRME